MKLELNCRKIIKRLKGEGWEEVLPRTRGSHRKFAKEGMGTLTVPDSKKDLRLKTARRIASDAGWLQDKRQDGRPDETEGKRRAERKHGIGRSGKEMS